MMILCQGAPFDIATTSGIAQSVMLRFVDVADVAKDISGNTFRCAVRGPGAAAIKCDPVDGSSARLAWSPLKAGVHVYDLFMITPDGTERPLIMGEIQAAPRVTPPGDEDVITIGDIKIMVPDAADGEVKIIDSSANAAERAEAAAQKAVDARTDVQNAKNDAEKAAERAGTSATNAASSATAAQQALASMPVDAAGNITAQGGTFARTVNANGGVNIPVAPVTAGNAVNLAHLPLMVFAPCQPIMPLKSLWTCSGAVEDTASGIHIKDVVAGAFGGVCTRVMQWSDYASTATILTVITLTGGNGANVLIDAAYNPNAGVSITPVTSPGMAFLPNAVQLSLFETRQGTTVTGRLVGVDGAVLEFSVPSQRDSHSCVYRVFLLETGSVIRAYLGKFTSGMFDGDADVLDRPVYLGEMPVPNNPRRFCFLGIGGIYGGEGNPFPARIPAISDVRRFYGKWLINLFAQL